MELLKTLESELSGLLRDVGQALQNFSDSVDASLEDNVGGVKLALRIVLSLGNLVVALVDLSESDNSLGALLALDFLGGEANGAGSLGGVVKVSQAEVA